LVIWLAFRKKVLNGVAKQLFIIMGILSLAMCLYGFLQYKGIISDGNAQESALEQEDCIKQLGDLKIVAHHNSVEFINNAETGSVEVMAWADDFKLQSTIPPQKGVRVVRWFQDDEKVPKVYVNHNLVKHEYDFNGCTMVFGTTFGAQ